MARTGGYLGFWVAEARVPEVLKQKGFAELISHASEVPQHAYTTNQGSLYQAKSRDLKLFLPRMLGRLSRRSPHSHATCAAAKPQEAIPCGGIVLPRLTRSDLHNHSSPRNVLYFCIATFACFLLIFNPALEGTMKDHAINADDLQLAQLGHAQSFERQFSRWTMLGLSFAILNSWTALAASLSLALPSGGPIAVIWGLVVAGICNLSLAASLAELLSAFRKLRKTAPNWAFG